MPTSHGSTGLSPAGVTRPTSRCGIRQLWRGDRGSLQICLTSCPSRTSSTLAVATRRTFSRRGGFTGWTLCYAVPGQQVRCCAESAQECSAGSVEASRTPTEDSTGWTTGSASFRRRPARTTTVSRVVGPHIIVSSLVGWTQGLQRTMARLFTFRGPISQRQLAQGRQPQRIESSQWRVGLLKPPCPLDSWGREMRTPALAPNTRCTSRPRRLLAAACERYR